MDQLKNLVGAAAAEDNVRLSFKGGLIFVEFDRRKYHQQQGRLGGELVSTGEISSQVYVAVKLRQQFGRDRPSVMVYDVEEAKKRYMAWQEAVNKEVAVRVEGQVEPPDMTVTEFQLHVVSLSSPDVFWVRYGQRATERMEIVERVISTCLPDLQRVKSAIVGDSQPCDCTLQGGGQGVLTEDLACYYRARVESTADEHATVFFVDYGNAVLA